MNQEELHKKCLDKDIDVRCRATDILCSMFSEVPDKQQAWDDLHRLIFMSTDLPE
jgi:hypothetical protein